MPRFHFDVLNDNNFIDEEGVDFRDLRTMREQAMRAAGMMVAEITDFPQKPWTMIVRDQEKKTVATLTFNARSA